MDEVQLFYYFIESERSPEDDPLVLWLTGGPGCSAFFGLVYEVGPLSFDYANSKTYSPKLKLNPYSWTKVANMIFLDAPVGSEFSYAKNWEGYNISDTSSVAEIYEFLRKWLLVHPKFLSNTLYVMGDSYSGITVPMVVQEISDGNEASREPRMNIKGYVLGNPLTSAHADFNARIPFAHLKTLISDELCESTKKDCNGEYIAVDPSNAACVDDLKVYTECTEQIRSSHILEPTCQLLSPKPRPRTSSDRLLIFLNLEDDVGFITVCIHTFGQMIKPFKRLFTFGREASTSYEVLIYSGDHDMVIPYIATHAWIESLNLTIAHDWRPWFVDGQVAGFTMQYTSKKYCLTFATLKGAGHTAPEYKPKESLAMIDSKRRHQWLRARLRQQMPKRNRGRGGHRQGRHKEEKWVSSISINRQNRSTSTHSVMGDWDSISAVVLRI
ncbi:hypothetical protein CMV_025836 [Castanea mollissima]|uniref:Serine carboxypeptidase-like 18 n=1 Tax=Castanea mollissima TaxID=60419 RepID=A0A8J4QDJ2_9ROSI|nr:hypothetical protein CMV_025836 [Castanea mollissima]